MITLHKIMALRGEINATEVMSYIWVSPVLAGVSVTEPYLGVWLVLRMTVAVIDHLHGFISYPHTGNNCSSLTCENMNIHCKNKMKTQIASRSADRLRLKGKRT